MALPFLHKFLTSLGRNKARAQPCARIDASLAVKPTGRGRPPDCCNSTSWAWAKSAPRKAGIFIYACRRAGEWRALYIGESADLSARLAFNEIAADALLSGATDIHILKTNVDAKERRDIADRLILTNAPPLNEEERIKLETTRRRNEISHRPQGTNRRAALAPLTSPPAARFRPRPIAFASRERCSA